ncbi:MAG: cytochrome c [Comamonadaceae bacterium]|nr:cytochrome c [Comamonadaceae bacterium]
MVARSLALLVSLAAVSATAAAADPNLARDLAATCASCHGTNGKSVGGMEPLDGETKQKIIDKINEYKSRRQAGDDHAPDRQGLHRSADRTDRRLLLAAEIRGGQQ